jgi:hypothetical protein
VDESSKSKQAETREFWDEAIRLWGQRSASWPYLKHFQEVSQRLFELRQVSFDRVQLVVDVPRQSTQKYAFACRFALAILALFRRVQVLRAA